MTEFFFL